MGISKRLKKIAEQVTSGYVLADIGTDHGYVPIYLLKEGIIPRAIAVDISKNTLKKAAQNAERYGLTERMECRLSDGFSNISPYEAECAVISGMGGILMTQIMENSPGVLQSLKELVLSPHRDAQLVRDFLAGHGFSLANDFVFEDKGKSYTIIKALNLNFTEL